MSSVLLCLRMCELRSRTPARLGAPLTAICESQTARRCGPCSGYRVRGSGFDRREGGLTLGCGVVLLRLIGAWEQGGCSATG